jgi:hypothetical protein
MGGATNISQGMHLMRRILTGALVTLTNVQSSLSIRCSDIDRTVSIPAGLRWLLLNSVGCDLDLRHTLAKVLITRAVLIVLKPQVVGMTSHILGQP